MKFLSLHRNGGEPNEIRAKKATRCAAFGSHACTSAVLRKFRIEEIGRKIAGADAVRYLCFQYCCGNWK